MARMKGILPIFIILFLDSFILSAQQAPPAAETSEVETAQVTVDDSVLFSVRGIKAYPAKERARAIAQQIRKIAADPKVKIDSLTVIETPTYTEIASGEITITRVYDADAALELEGLPRQTLAKVFLEKIKKAIEKYRLDRTSDRLLRSGLTALGASAGFAAVLFLFLWLFRKLMALIEAKTKAKILTLQAKSYDLLKAERVGFVLTGFLRATRLILALTLIYIYLNFMLGLFPWTRLLSRHLTDYLVLPVQKIGLTIVNYIPDLIFIIIIVLVARYGLKLVRLFFSGIEKKTIAIRGFEPDWAIPTYKIVRLLVIVLCAVVIYPYIPGTGSLAFKGISVFAGLLISLGASSVISNILAGYTMVYRRASHVGDRVKIGDFLGDVTEMRLLVTHLMSPKNEEIVVPNSLILNSQVVNYSSFARNKNLILHTNVTIGYDTPWRQVNALLLMAAERTPGILREPKPFVFQKSLGDYYVDYELNAFTDAPQAMWQTYSDLHKNILDAFNEYGVQITSPNYVSDPDGLKIVPKDKWYAAPAKPSTDSETGEKK